MPWIRRRCYSTPGGNVTFSVPQPGARGCAVSTWHTAPVITTRVGFVLGCLVLASCGAGRVPDPAAAMSRACRCLASQQQPSGAIALGGRVLNPNVWETANALIALMRCDPSTYRAVIAKGFAFLDANWINKGGLPE